MQSRMVNRVPAIILLYWVIKIASTTLGETGADMFSMTFDIGYGRTIAIFMALFVFFLGLKLRSRKYTPFLYWSVFTATAIAGTAISDFIDRTLGLGYASGSAILTSLLLLVLALWYQSEKTISVEKIHTFRAELFYWIAFLIANTLGTAAGDFLADDLGIGFLNSSIVLAAALLVLGLLHAYSKISGILLFWLAFVLTRPFGAAFGDLLTKSTGQGGLDFGTVGASSIFGVLLILSIAKETQLEYARKQASRNL